MPAGVRLATHDDVELLARTLALAHLDYAWAVWAFPAAGRVELLRRLFELDLQAAVRVQSAWTTLDGACVAIWSPPRTTALDSDTAAFIAEVNQQQNALIGAGAARLHTADALTRPHHPTTPYWYLGTIGTRPDSRGRGLATDVLQPVLRRCDDDGTVACLETSSDANVRLYQRLGFDQVFTTTTDDGLLPLMVMVRQPR